MQKVITLLQGYKKSGSGGGRALFFQYNARGKLEYTVTQQDSFALPPVLNQFNPQNISEVMSQAFRNLPRE